MEGLICQPKALGWSRLWDTFPEDSNGIVFCFSKVTWKGHIKWNERKNLGGTGQGGGSRNAVGASDKGLSQDWGSEGQMGAGKEAWI